ncbi:MAG: GGDEF domain-containing protein [Pseudomonadota bacterium]
MTVQPDATEISPSAVRTMEDLRARLTPMLRSDKQARLIVNRNADIVCTNRAGNALIAGWQNLPKDAKTALLHWLYDAASDAYEIKLEAHQTLDAQAPNTFALCKTELHIDDGDQLFLVIARQPNLNAHLIQALSQSRALYKDIAQAIPGLLWETRSDGRFSFIGGAEMTGIEHSELVDVMPHEAFDVPADVARSMFSAEADVQSVDLWVTTYAGRRCLSVSAKPTLSKTGMWVGARGIALDVTADRLESDAADTASQQMLSEAQTDALTGLLNRRGFEQQLEKICGQIRAADAGGYLALIDLDKFKQLNDTHGHQKGDEALVLVAELLDRHTRRGDLCARLGGDEFIIWIDDASTDGAQRICQSLIASMPELCVDMGLKDFGLGMSIGVTQLRPGRDTAMSLVERADQTMYKVKKSGRGAYLFGDEEAD